MSENNVNENLHIGIDVGSTTVKLAILDDANQIRYAVYRRHHADVRATIVEVLSEAAKDFGDKRMTIAITGSGGCFGSNGWASNSCRKSLPAKPLLRRSFRKPMWPSSWVARTRRSSTSTTASSSA